MITSLAKKVFGSRNDRLLKQYRKSVVRINGMEKDIQQLDDAALQAKTAEFKQRLAKGETFTQRSIENIVLNLNATVERRKSGAAIDDNGTVT